ncbi:TetR/AcrR family transcriptional regulator [Bacillus sp. CFBP9009]
MKSVVDPRVTRTRRLLMDALANLIILEGHETITVREIVRKAEVNRSTFYLHFLDKQDILTQFQNDILSELKESLKQPKYSYQAAVNDFKNLNKPIDSHVAMFEHIEKQSSIYKKMLTESEFRERFTKEIITKIFHFRESIWEATYMANGAVGIILFWLENGMKETVTEMSLWLTKSILFPLGEFDN